MGPEASAARPLCGLAILCSATSAAFPGNSPKIKGVTAQTPPVLSGAGAEQDAAGATKGAAVAEKGAKIFGGAAREAGQNVPWLINKVKNPNFFYRKRRENANKPRF